MQEIILGSRSPRRRELLKLADIPFKILVKEVEEVFPQNISAEKVPEYLACLKNRAYKELRNEHIVLTADTIVILENQILGKPENLDHAKRLLQMLSGKKHEVVTGVCIAYQKHEIVFSEKTSVWFYELSEEQIDYYVSKYKPLDKAGGYAIQEWIGAIGIRKIEGDLYNVIGLPVAKVVKYLQKIWIS